MALINCPECNKEISDQADNCPNCGFPIKQSIPNKKFSKKRIRFIVLVLVFVLLVGGAATWIILNNIAIAEASAIASQQAEASALASQQAEASAIASEQAAEASASALAAQLTPEEELALKAVNALLGIMKDPKSVQFHNIEIKKFYGGLADSYVVKIDCTGENGLGGVDRDNFYISMDSGEVNPYWELANTDFGKESIMTEWNNRITYSEAEEIDFERLKVWMED